jgi:hypothetical protein
MGKKNDTTKPAHAAAAPAESTKAAKPPPEPAGTPAAAAPPAANGDSGAGTPAKVAAKKKPAPKKKTPAKKKVVTFSTEDIALKAYFIAEHRHRHGIHGDEHSDWIKAERQLRAEHRKKTARKKPSKKRV